MNLILKRSGYSSSFYYGGDINFASMKSYFVNGKYDRIVSVDDFPSNENTARWGVPDHVAFAKLWEDVHVSPSPFFKVLFTLSSHEPFDIPVTPSFGAGTEEKRFLSAIRYTDACLGSFLDSLKQSPRWKRTLVLLVADHGSRLPGNSQVYEPDKFRIPLLITGGALKSGPRVLPEIVSQTDIPATLLGLLNLPTADFPFSQNLARQAPDRAFYAFNNGFGLIAGHGVLVYDLPGRHAIAGNEALTPDLLQKGQAFLQEVSEWMETH